MIAIIHRQTLIISAVILGTLILQASYIDKSELFFKKDEMYHAMTGVFFRDLLEERPTSGFRQWAETHYAKYPALSIFIWPPLFHLIEGVTLLILGISVMAAKIPVLAFLAFFTVCFYRLVKYTHGFRMAVSAVVFAVLAPLVFEYGHHVMLEIPTLALCTASLFYFMRYSDTQRSRDIFSSAVYAALAALTKFTAVFLLPLFLFVTLWNRRFSMLFSGKTLFAALLAIVLVAPYYLVSLSFFGRLLYQNAAGGVYGLTGLTWENVYFYPMVLPSQLGPVIFGASVFGILAAVFLRDIGKVIPYASWILAGYTTFSPMAELDTRHTLCWIPAFAFFAAYGLDRLSAFLAPKNALSAFLLGVFSISAITLFINLKKPVSFIRGYEDAAKYVMTRVGDRPVILFNGYYNANFIFFIRKHDPRKEAWVLRGSKLFYSVYINPVTASETYAETEADVVSIIDSYGPAYIVVENRNWTSLLPVNDLILKTLASRPERYDLEETFPVESYPEGIGGTALMVYRNKGLKPSVQKDARFRIMVLDKDLIVPMP